GLPVPPPDPLTCIYVAHPMFNNLIDNASEECENTSNNELQQRVLLKIGQNEVEQRRQEKNRQAGASAVQAQRTK
ncbi:MAG TPA: hypothetical protein PLQ35_18210, partial [bacterium]|nr:hypothetical protein [bacterium]HQL64212.1 hypothetical protein [bacterium]